MAKHQGQAGQGQAGKLGEAFLLLIANFDREFFGLFPVFQAPQNFTPKTSRPNLSTFLSFFTFSNQKFIHAIFLLTGETNNAVAGGMALRLLCMETSDPKYDMFSGGSVRTCAIFVEKTIAQTVFHNSCSFRLCGLNELTSQLQVGGVLWTRSED